MWDDVYQLSPEPSAKAEDTICLTNLAVFCCPQENKHTWILELISLDFVMHYAIPLQEEMFTFNPLYLLECS